MNAPAMKMPIIEIRQRNLFVLTEFEGVISDDVMQTAHNMMGNWTQFVIDSNGDLWSFVFVGTDHVGIRRWFSALVSNISRDRYACRKEANISVERFRGIVAPYRGNADPHQREMASALHDSLAGCTSSDPLREHIHLLRL